MESKVYAICAGVSMRKSGLDQVSIRLWLSRIETQSQGPVSGVIFAGFWYPSQPNNVVETALPSDQPDVLWTTRL